MVKASLAKQRNLHPEGFEALIMFSIFREIKEFPL